MRKFIVISILGFFAMNSPCWAEPFRQHTFGIVPEVYRFVYEEPGISMKEQGMMYGGCLFYAYHKDPEQNSWMMRLEQRAGYGQVDYSQEVSGSIDNIVDYMMETRALFGYDLHTEPGSVYTFYTGFGYRYLNDDSKGTVSTKHKLGYERESNYYYTPFGLEAVVDYNNGWAAGAELEFDWVWLGRQISHLGDASSVFGTVHNNQNKGIGLRGALKLMRKTQAYDFTFGPFIRYWSIDDSEHSQLLDLGDDDVLIGLEPRNRTTEFGGTASLQF